MSNTGLNSSGLGSYDNQTSIPNTPSTFSLYYIMAISIRRFPPHVLLKVFHYYLRLPASGHHSCPAICVTRTTSPNVTPIILSQVCSSWRRLACSTPSLWSSIFVFGPSINHLSLIELWLQRSCNEPLTLALTQFKPLDYAPSKHLDALNALLRIFLRHSQRWKQIYFNFDHYLKFAHPGEALILLSSPHLCRLSMIEVVEIAENVGWSPLWTQELWTQLLKNSTLRNAVCGFPAIGCANLTSLVCRKGALSIAGVFVLLNAFPNLETFEATLGCPPNAPSPPNHYTVHRKLQNLRLTHMTAVPGLMEPVITRLTAPQLTKLEVTFDGGRELTLAIRNMILRSACSLRTLGRIDIKVAPNDAIRLFSLPELNNLRSVQVSNVDSNFLQWLTLPLSGHGEKYRHNLPTNMSSNLPNLKYLHIDGIVMPVHYALSHMIVSRFSTERITIEGSLSLDEIPLSDQVFAHPGVELYAKTGIAPYHSYDLTRNHPGRQIRTRRNSRCASTSYSNIPGEAQ